MVRRACLTVGIMVVLVAPAIVDASAPSVSGQSRAARPLLPGNLAYVSYGRLFILDGATGRTQQITRSTMGSVPAYADAPAWSPEGRWLAYSLLRATPQGESRIWMVRANGTGAHAVPGFDMGTFRWSPSRDVVAAMTGTVGRPRSGLLLIPPWGRSSILATNLLVHSFAWSPDGKTMALSGVPRSAGRPTSDRLYTVDVASGRVTRRSRLSPGQVSLILLAGWWPGNGGLLYWVDSGASTSHLLDGLNLYDLNLASGRVRRLAKTLVYSDWIVPSAGRLLVVAGWPRPAYYNKHLLFCTEGTACHPLIGRRGVVWVDPAWSPDGEDVAFVAAKSLPGAWGFTSSSQLWQWIHSHTLWIARLDGSHAHPVMSAGHGIQEPRWSRDGRGMLLVKDNALWFDAHVGAGKPRKIAQLVPSIQVPKWTYGHMSWDSLFAWYQGVRS